MAGETKERILETALELFAQSGYLGTSMSDIAGELGITKGALYKHYAGKQEILDSIVKRMNQMDYDRAEEYEMPETEPDGGERSCEIQTGCPGKGRVPQKLDGTPQPARNGRQHGDPGGQQRKDTFRLAG